MALNTSTFNAVFYLSQNPDVATAVGQGLFTALQHFQRFGTKESRNPNAFFNTAYYLSKNPDVAAAVSAGTIDALTHFANFGAKESRDTNVNFNTTAYLLNNPDVSAAVRAGLFTALDHWNLFGRNENRVAFDNSSPPKLIPAGTIISVTIGVAQAGSTFNLTTSTDNLTGTTGNDTFAALFDVGTSTLTTFNNLDTIRGSAAGNNNTLSLRVVDDSTGGTGLLALSSLVGPTVVNVQNINISTLNAGGGNNGTTSTTFVYNATNTSGATQWSVAGNSQITTVIQSIGNVASSANGATVSNVGLLGNSGAVALQFNTALLTGTSDTLNLVVSGVNNGSSVIIGNANGSGFETVNITATANGSLLNPFFGDTTAGAQAFTVAGSGNLQIGNNNAVSGSTTTNSGVLKFGITSTNSTGTLNASAFTGALNVSFFDNNAAQGVP